MTDATKRYVYSFQQGDGHNKMLLGGKGANLCEMTQIGLNVPPGFTITTEACLEYLGANRTLPGSVMQQVREQMAALEQMTGKGFGDAHNPLLVSVRSGAAMSMPGMMDTILNLGLNRHTLQGEIEQTGDERFAYDAYRRFIQLFGKVALDIPDELFDEPFEAIKHREGVREDVGLSAENMKEITGLFLEVVHSQTGRPFPEDPFEQLELAIKAVFNSWMGRRAIDYRREFKITPGMANGTAVNICTMVFGNRGNDSATGVAFTRNPGTGVNEFFGEYLVNAQGEDVVAGIRTPKPIARMRTEMPDLYRQLEELRGKLESHYHEIQDFEFTIEKGTLYCLQTRNGKMNTQAMVRTSVELVEEGLISREAALLRINPESLEQMLFPRLDAHAGATPIACGLPASPGAASGHVVFDADRAEQQGRTGKRIILLREETKPEDIHGFFASQAILTSRGGKTSHAAVVARGMGKPCVAGAEGIEVDVTARRAHIGDVIIKEGDLITVDGTTGNVYLGTVNTVEAEFTDELKTLLSWADQAARLKVLANADIPVDAERALKYGAMGIGLCRTERMFNASDRLPIVLEMIVADSLEQRQAALDKLLPIQRHDFIALFKTMAPNPVTVRLLDPPIHEFLPSEQQLISDLKQLRHLRDSLRGAEILSDTISLLFPNGAQGGSGLPQVIRVADSSLVDEAIDKKEAILKKVRSLFEVNPMLGHRGVRLGITYPEIYAMQIRAILEAACECHKQGVDVYPEIMVPQVCTPEELRAVRKNVDHINKQVSADFGFSPIFKFGTMIEVVRACMRAETLAKEADFFSFGTNDLTQATFSFSREDAENKFLPLYNESGILRDNPFEVLDTHGVGKLMELAIGWGRTTKPDLKIGICGEHGGHPASIRFCHGIGLSYVSCSGPRVPIARLAAAHAALLQPTA
ncbi:pyruvate, phosphate dikinase [Mariprofundus erugo]|uniref:Pyruvate, phosphate dikinase n=1 Tax=Mariprofundus erugo TaxID=2528639 RepID=A0A5R9GRY0_9PROT|nr:pyruvate, phosphate dikinase [Mariprofundus erugo]TLS65994.1 pyruvate, phosphate dikinase [Mariprofundus erugo]TLS76349.1 pyruvate, phosphate dikinase [Mariprofundus erugo]